MVTVAALRPKQDYLRLAEAEVSLLLIVCRHRRESPKANELRPRFYTDLERAWRPASTLRPGLFLRLRFRNGTITFYFKQDMVHLAIQGN